MKPLPFGNRIYGAVDLYSALSACTGCMSTYAELIERKLPRANRILPRFRYVFWAL
jgi:hypothetical protein